MARYKLMNVQIKKVGERIDANGNKTFDTSVNPDGKRRFLTASLIPVGGIWAAAAGSLPPIFDEAVIKAYEPCISVANGGTAQTDQPLPDDLAYLNGAWAEWVAPAPFYKKYLVGVPARKPTPLAPAGRKSYPAGHRVMNADGSQPVIYTSIRIFTVFGRDEDLGNQIVYRPGFSVNDLGQQQFNNYCEYVNPPSVPLVTEEDVTGGNNPFIAQPPTGAAPNQGQVPNQQQGQQPPTFTQNPNQQGSLVP